MNKIRGCNSFGQSEKCETDKIFSFLFTIFGDNTGQWQLQITYQKESFYMIDASDV